MKYTNPGGLSLDYARLDDDHAQMLLMVMAGTAQKGEGDILRADNPFLKEAWPIAIMQQRIDSFNLPIRLTEGAAYSLLAIGIDNPGKAVAATVDCLNLVRQRFSSEDKMYEASEDKITVTSMDICVKIYPHGFYSEDGFTDYVDNYLKNHKYKATHEGRWARIY